MTFQSENANIKVIKEPVYKASASVNGNIPVFNSLGHLVDSGLTPGGGGGGGLTTAQVEAIATTNALIFGSMKTTQIENYTFTKGLANAGTVAFTEFNRFGILKEKIIAIINATTGVIIYSITDPLKGGTVGTGASKHLLTLAMDTNTMANSDKLTILYSCGGTVTILNAYNMAAGLTSAISDSLEGVTTGQIEIYATNIDNTGAVVKLQSSVSGTDSTSFQDIPGMSITLSTGTSTNLFDLPQSFSGKFIRVGIAVGLVTAGTVTVKLFGK